MNRLATRVVSFLASWGDAIDDWLGLVWRSIPNGCKVAAKGFWGWLRDERRRIAVDSLDQGDKQRPTAENKHQRVMRDRGLIVAGSLAVVYVLLWGHTLPGVRRVRSTSFVDIDLVDLVDWRLLLLLVVVGFALGVAGIPVDVPKVPTVVYLSAGGDEPRVDEPLILKGLRAADVSKLTRALDSQLAGGPPAIEFDRIPADDGSGVMAEFTLPLGVNVSHITSDEEKNRAFAGGMGRPPSKVLLTVADTDEREVAHCKARLYVADRSLGELGDLRWDLLPKKGPIQPISAFGPIPIGRLLRGRAATVTTFQSGHGAWFGTVCGATGSGKTKSYITLVLGLLLDPIVELRIHDFKDQADWLDIGDSCAYVFHAGADLEAVEVLNDSLTEQEREIYRRGQVMRQLLREDRSLVERGYCPEIATRRDLGMHPIINIIDEPIPFTKPDKESDGEALAKAKGKARKRLVSVGQRGRAVGISTMVLLQSINDVVLPKLYTDNAGLRIAFRVADASAANQALRPGAAGMGYRADQIPKLPGYRGVGYIDGEGAGIEFGKWAYVTGDDRLEVCAAGRQFRIDNGRLSGHAGGEQDERVPRRFQVLIDLVHVVSSGADGRVFNGRLSYADAVELLARRVGGDYQALTPEGLSKQLRTPPISLPGSKIASDIRGTKGHRGFKIDDLHAALARVDTNTDTDVAEAMSGDGPVVVSSPVSVQGPATLSDTVSDNVSDRVSDRVSGGGLADVVPLSPAGGSDPTAEETVVSGSDDGSVSGRRGVGGRFVPGREVDSEGGRDSGGGSVAVGGGSGVE